MKNCKQCDTGFEITDWDRSFYAKTDVPEPALCPRCRSQRRQSWGNQVNLYKRKCDATGESLVSAYYPDSSLKVYKQNYWGDLSKFDALEYGRDYDFNRPFFEQWFDLAKEVPRPALHTAYQFDENSDYTNYAGHNKNGYMLFDSDFNWDCLYGMGVNKSKNCVDNYRIKECELCFECVDCTKCYRLFYSQDCENCSDSAFLKNCIGVKNSFMCSNLKNKEYHIFNQPFTKEKYQELMQSLSRQSELQKYFKDWEAFKLRFPQKFMHGVQNENVLGDYLVYSKNAEQCFESMELWDCKYFTRGFGDARDCMDCDECGDKVERLYNSAFSGYNLQNLRCTMFCFDENHDLDYCFYCNYCQNCFGCVGLKRKKFCILNKQYSEAEYKALVPKIIDHMRATGEWGEFFPAQYSDFAYNQTLANDYFPLSKEAALAKGWRWRDPDQKEYQPATARVPDDSRQADGTLCNEILACEDCGRNYKIIEQELKFYQEQTLPIPKQCFYCRNTRRFNMRNPRLLFSRNCEQCGVDVKTSYAPERPEKVFCEKCYLESLE